MPNAWNLAREYHWLLRRLGLDEVAKKTQVAVGRIYGFLRPGAAGGYNPLTKIVWIEQWKGRGMDAAMLSHELAHRAGLGEWGAYYTFVRALNEVKEGVVINYRKAVEGSHRSGKMRALVSLPVFLIPTAASILTKNPMLLSVQVPMVAAYLYTARRILRAHKSAEEVRYLRWLFKRGVKKGLKMNKEDYERFVEGRREELRYREMMPTGIVRPDVLRKMDAGLLLQMLSRYLGSTPEEVATRYMLWHLFLKRYEKLPNEEKVRVLLSGSSSIPRWFFNVHRPSSKG